MILNTRPHRMILNIYASMYITLYNRIYVSRSDCLYMVLVLPVESLVFDIITFWLSVIGDFSL